MNDSAVNARRKFVAALNAIVPGSASAILLDQIIASLHQGDLRADQPDFAFGEKALALLRPFVFTPEDPDALEKIGFSTKENLPVTRIVMNRYAVGDVMAFNWSDVLESISMPNALSIGGRLYLNVPATELTAPNLASMGGMYVDFFGGPLALDALETCNGQITLNNGAEGFTSFSARSLKTIDGNFFINGPGTFTSLVLPALETNTGLMNFGLIGLQELLLPSLITAPQIEIADLPLTNVYMPKFLPTNGGVVNFSGNALPSAVINHILARCVASTEFVSGLVVLQSGTNGVPTGQGLTDVATLLDRGVTVTVNS